MVAEARVEELLDYVNKELHKIKRAGKLPGGVVLTGGTSKLPGLDEFTREKLQLPARVGSLRDVGGLVDTVEGQSYINRRRPDAVGYAVTAIIAASTALPRARERQSILEWPVGRFRANK